MAYPPLRSLLVVMLSALAIGCGHKIGDECQTSVDCSQGGERLCDITQPGGYCTVFNCEPGTCPEESSCIAFGAALSTASACQDNSGLSRLERAFCMLTCSSDKDCRAGYSCVDLGASDNAWRNALPIDRDRSSKVCVASFDKPADSGEGGAASDSIPPAPNVCSGPGPATGGSSGASSGGASSGGASSGGASSGGASSPESAGAGGSGG